MSTRWGLSDSQREHHYVDPLAEAVRNLEDAQHDGPFRSGGPGATLTRCSEAGGVLVVKDDPEAVEADLAAGLVACPGCGGRLARWGFGSERELRTLAGVRRLRPRRARCSSCGARPPGVGKTISARHYAHWDVVEPQLRRYAFGSGRSPEAAAARSVVYTPMVANTPRMVDKELVDLSRRLNYVIEDTLVDASEEDAEDDDNETFPIPSYAEVQHVELVIVDEADRLRMPSLEQLRDHYDRRKIGLVLIGMPGLEKRLARYPQLYSRVGFVHQYRPLGAEELRFILQTHWETLGLRLSPEDFTDAEAMAAVARITGGNFRLVHRLLAQVERILGINKITVISKEVVEAARESLVIGAT